MSERWDRRDRKRRKRPPIHGRSLIHILNAQQKRGRQARLDRQSRQAETSTNGLTPDRQRKDTN